MKKVLVVEDEKLIRQGIAAMIKRSGVPVEEVIECSNGQAAMDILKSESVDLMFTDIRMPKMNGIELTQAVQSLDNPPITVAISGYDDFSYAVEMMRQGVREYILKPVEREKLKAILEKINEEIENRNEDRKKSDAMDIKLLNYMLKDNDLSKEDIGLMETKLQDEVGANYVVIVTDESASLPNMTGICLKGVQNSNVFIVPSDEVANLINARYIGVSDVYTSIVELKDAYELALKRRIEAFMQNMSLVDDVLPSVPEELLKSAAKLTEPATIMARIQLMGTDRVKELKKEWDGFFIAAARGQISPKDFIEAINIFAEEYEKQYRAKLPESIKFPIMTDCLDSYREKFTSFVLDEQSRISENVSQDQTAAKIKEAINYINENYYKDLNMAVVSNHISMNYSLFSAEFKHYTGTNFVQYVKDLRMKEAKRLLKETEMKVNEISAKVGYDNEKHFMKSFKSFVGVSPSEYRRNCVS